MSAAKGTDREKGRRGERETGRGRRGDGERGRRGEGDGERGRRGERETGRERATEMIPTEDTDNKKNHDDVSASPALPVSPSPPLPVSPSPPLPLSLSPPLPVSSSPPLSLSSSPPLPLSPSPRLPRSAVVIGFVSLLSDISSEMIYPVLPLFLTETLRAPATVVGLIEGIAVGASTAIGGISGWLSDRLGRRKPVAFIGYALTALTRPLIAGAQVWPVVLGARFAERFGKGIRNAPRDALLAESTAHEFRGRAFGFERAMDSAGAVIGPLVALMLVGWANLGARSIFLISGIPAALAALLILTVKERGDKRTADASSLKFSIAGTTPEYKRLLLVTGVFGLANSANAFLILRSEQLGLNHTWTILAYALYNAVASLASMPAGAASDRFGRRNVMIIGFAIYALSYVGFGVANAGWLVWPLFALYGLFPALTDGVGKAMAVDSAGTAGRATVIGIYSMVMGVTQIAASYIGGMLWDRIDSRATFYFGAVLAGIAACLLVVLIPGKNNNLSTREAGVGM
jgi:MFS family permease